MRVSFDFSKESLGAFENKCEALISKVGNGSRKALLEACNVISEASLNQVPRDTETLAMSHFYEVTGHYKTGWTATIGYGGNGDPINPKSGKRASTYMTKVHDDLLANHPNGGKAKFLEDPVRDFANEKFPRTVYKYMQDAISSL